MSTSSAEYWLADGVSLNQYAWSVTSWGGSPRGLPSLRGDDIVLPYRAGRQFQTKVAESRSITLNMFVIGMDPDTDGYVADPRVQLTDNIRQLQRLFWTPNRQISLVRRWEVSSGVIAGTALAQTTGGMEPEMTGRGRAMLSVDLLLSDPFFYGTALTPTAALEPTDTTSVTNPGDQNTTGYNSTITFTGPLTNPRLTNTTANPDIWVQYNGTVSSGQSVVIDLWTSIAKIGSTTVTGNLSCGGSRYLFQLLPDTNALSFTAASGTGTCTFSIRPPYV